MSKRIRGKPDSVFLRTFDIVRREATIPLSTELLRASSDLTREPRTGRALETICTASNAPLFDLAPRRVWLFSLQRLPLGLPLPAVGSVPWTFSLFHCSSSYDGGSLTPALPSGVRTFLSRDRNLGSNRLRILMRGKVTASGGPFKSPESILKSVS